MDQVEQLTILIEKAIENGWKCPDRSVRAYSTYLHQESRINELLFGDDLSFLKTLFGEELVGGLEINHHTVALRIKQWAVDYLGTVHAVPEGQRYFQVTKAATPKLSDYIDSEEVDLVDLKRVEFKLKDLFAAVPFNTHRLEDVSVYGSTPRFQRVAEHLVTIPEDQRIPWLYSQLFGEEQL